MANVLLAYPDKAATATLSGGSWLAALPLANAQTTVLSQVARSSDTRNESTIIEANFGRSTAVGAFALANHNLSTAARVRLSASSASDFATLTYDSEWQPAWPSVYSVDLLEWEDDNWWSGALTAEQLGTTRPIYIHVLTSTSYGWYWRIEIDDVNNGDAYVEIGRVFMAPSWTPAINMTYGASYQWEPLYDVSVSLGGTRYFSPRAISRLMRFRLDAMTKAEAFSRAFDLQRQLGAHGELLVISDSDDTETMQQRAFLARLQTMGEVAIAGPSHYACDFALQEVI